jgi:hypothetical protein
MAQNKTFEDGKWLYGDSWEHFPINDGEVWQAGKNLVAVRDLTLLDNLDCFGQDAFDMSYIDPPWNTGNINSFYTKAGLSDRNEFGEFLKKLLALVKKHSPKINYLEMGCENLTNVKNMITAMEGIVTNHWKIKYYRKNPCYLIRYTFIEPTTIDFDFTGIDDDYTPRLAMQFEKNVNTVLDLCTGRGLTGRTALAMGKTFYGTELNKRRLACLIDYFSKQGLSINKL